MLDEIIPQITRQLAPYEITETRRLKTDKTDDAVMEQAMDLVKADKLDQARELFLQRWKMTANLAAGYNAAVLYEAGGDLENALQLLGELVRISNDSTITSEYKFVLDALKESRQAKEQMQ